jgi:ribose transport system substrate-binding protein
MVASGAVALALLLAACSSGSGSTGSTSTAASGSNGSINVGNGTPIKWKAGTTPKIAYFIAGTSDSYLVAEENGAKAAAKKAGVDLTVFDGQFNTQTQISQITDATTSGQYNAFIINAEDGDAQCQEISKQLPAKNIPVITVVTPICGRTYKDGTAAWAPGTINFVGGTEGVAMASALWQQAVKDNSGTQNVAFFGGPQNGGPTEAAYRALQQTLKAHPDFKLVGTYYTDYTTGDGLAKAQTLLQAHPDVNIILSAYAGVTQGVAEALQAAGKEKSVKVYDMGGNQFDEAGVKAGTIAAFTPYFPYSAGAASVNQMLKALKGTQVSRYVGLDGHAPIKGADANYPVIKSSNIANFTAEYQ